MLNQLKSLAVFATVVEKESFRGAAKSLNISPSVVSHHIAKLEKELGVALIFRSTRNLSLTNEGEKLFISAFEMLNNARTGIGAFCETAEEPIINFKVALPSLLSHHPVFNRIIKFANEHPGTLLNLVTSDNMVDLIKGRVDVAIRMGLLKDSELKTKKIAQDERVTVASPAYLKKYGHPQQPNDLKEHRLVRFTIVPPEYSFTKPASKMVKVEGKFTISTDSVQITKAIALSGMAIAGLPSCIAQNDIDSGKLIKLLPDWSGQTLGIYAVWIDNVGINPTHKSFLKYISK